MLSLLELESLRRENGALRKKRGHHCRCRGNCTEHVRPGTIIVRLELCLIPSTVKGALPRLTVRTKRKQFDQLSVYGKRRGLKDLRGLFKKKEAEYNAPVSRMAGFIMQQVREVL